MKYLVFKNCLTLLFFVALIFTSCDQKSANESDSETEAAIPDEKQIEEKLYEEVMAVHDEMMPKMEDMMRMKGQLVEKRDTTKTTASAEEIERLNQLITDLTAADEAMMSWMRNFEPVEPSQSHEAVVDYYTAQKEKMDSVKEEMQAAIEAAQKELN